MAIMLCGLAGLSSGFAQAAWSMPGVSGMAQSGAPCALGMTDYSSVGIGRTKGSPYAATIRTTFDQNLSDGNTIHRETTTHQARSAAGQTRMESVRGCQLGEDGQPHSTISVTVNNLEASTSLSWQEGETEAKVATVFHRPPPAQRPGAAISRASAGDLAVPRQIQGTSHREDLGTKTIAGMLAEGIRTIRTIPAGAEGNSLPIETIMETWHSRASNLTLMFVTDDPRRGRTTVEVTELTPGEPDPALFAPPAGYTLREVGASRETTAP